MSKYLFGSYVAIGDSLTEGLGDFDFEQNRIGCGWADRLAQLLGKEAFEAGENFDYANLSLRGSSLFEILTAQLEETLSLKPDLVTIMAGANDFMRPRSQHPAMRALLRGAIERLLNEGSHVVVVNTVNPNHLRVFKPVVYKAREMNDLINAVADEYGVPVLNVFDMNEFSDLKYWCDDRVHFSGHGHIRIANEAASLLGLDHGFDELADYEIDEHNVGLVPTLKWFFSHVVPYIGRRIRRKSSGDGMEPKHTDYVRMVYKKTAKTPSRAYAA